MSMKINGTPIDEKSNWTPEIVRKVAIRNQKRQQPSANATTSPKKQPIGSKGRSPEKGIGNQRKQPGEIFEQASKQAAQQNSELFAVNRSVLQIDTSAIRQSENTRLFKIDSDTNSTQKVMATNDASLFMTSSPDSPSIGKDYSD